MDAGMQALFKAMGGQPVVDDTKRCGACRAEGQESQVTPSSGFYSTMLYCAPHYDEQGRQHSHDSNTTTRSYRCSRGHTWQLKEGGACWCGWRSQPE